MEHYHKDRSEVTGARVAPEHAACDTRVEVASGAPTRDVIQQILDALAVRAAAIYSKTLNS